MLDEAEPLRIHLIDGTSVAVDGRVLDVPEGGKRLIAYVALQGHRVGRRRVAGVLWPVGSDDRAAGNLRSWLWRLRSAGIDVLDSDKSTVSVAPGTRIDVRELRAWADRLIACTPRTGDLEWCPPMPAAAELLSGWDDDWVVMERERLRQRVLHALEAQSRQLGRQGRYADAVESALVSVNSEPLRESAQRTLIAAHVAEGNIVEARRALRIYVELLGDELGLNPSVEMVRLLSGQSGTALRVEPAGVTNSGVASPRSATRAEPPGHHSPASKS